MFVQVDRATSNEVLRYNFFVKNQMGIQPGHAFQIEKDNAWLPWKKRSGRASQNQHHETLIYVVTNAQTHAVPMGKALNEARVYRTTDRCWLVTPSPTNMEVL